jgi:uncharacterized UBP type Zn finger protein
LRSLLVCIALVDYPEFLSTFVQWIEMGFPEVRARKALMNGGNMQAAMDWLGAHQEDADIDDPIPLVPKNSAGGEVQSWKCSETGKLFRTWQVRKSCLHVPEPNIYSLCAGEGC